MPTNELHRITSRQLRTTYWFSLPFQRPSSQQSREWQLCFSSIRASSPSEPLLWLTTTLSLCGRASDLSQQRSSLTHHQWPWYVWHCVCACVWVCWKECLSSRVGEQPFADTSKTEALLLRHWLVMCTASLSCLVNTILAQLPCKFYMHSSATCKFYKPYLSYTYKFYKP